MKVKFKYGIQTYSGTLDEMTYGAYRKGNICIGRKHVTPALTIQNNTMGAIMKNLSSVYQGASPDYIDDLKDYSLMNGRENVSNNQLPPTAYAIFVKMMFAWQKSSPSTIDLETVTIEDILSLPAPIVTVSGAINAGFLRDVSGSEFLTDDIG